MTAQDFSLPDQNSKEHKLSEYLNKWVVLYFYPKDDTTGCTTEACNFRDSFHELQKRNVVILGVSKDSVKSHKKFADKYELNFPLLSDENQQVINMYHAWGKKKYMGKEYEGILRKTYLISPEGKIVKIYENVNPTIHSNQILEDLTQLQS